MKTSKISFLLDNQRTEFANSERVQGKYLKTRDAATLQENKKWTNRQ